MFDSVGHTGGCQDAYTVMPPTNSSQNCNNTLSVPRSLSVQGSTWNGPLTEYGWPDQCTTISLMAQNGTPPFTMTVAPSLHPPLNLTFENLGPMDWTVTLAWGMRFWISLVDATGASWTYGPLHSGGNGPTDCLHLAGNSLTVQPSMPGSSHVSVGATIGIAMGALVYGIVFTLALQWLWGYLHRRHKTDDHVMQATSSHPGIDPYPIASLRSQPPQVEARSDGNPSTTEHPVDSQVYVVHHDAGGAPITIFTAGREVQELPPHYTGTSPEPRPTHTPSTSMDSTSRSTGTRRKPTPPLRSITD
ncbi:hypothetical protein JB92DRAFT_2920701 [Gautieria morchelliformis]|nr:hypothetical protein JB92DRAFT_2920701 [Gautieria morchelliformis]